MASFNDSGDLVAVGRVIGVHGLKGELKVESLTDFPERFDPGSSLFLVTSDGEVRTAEVVASRAHKGRVLLTVKGVEDRTEAEKLRGSFFKIAQTDLTPLPEGQYYHFQLVGLTVRSEDGKELGRVEEVMPTGSNLVLTVRGSGGEVLIPFIDDVIREVNLEGRSLTVHLLPGLLPEEGN
jgi:16S rRNA processing protein RimM